MADGQIRDFKIDEFYIPEADIPSSVRKYGGCIDVRLVNKSYGNHHYYLSVAGTYLPNVKNVQDKGL